MGYFIGYREEDRSPRVVNLVGRFFKHLFALAELFKKDEPDLRVIRGATILEVLYIFGDASGSGFGSSWTEGISIGYRFGVCNEEGYGTISNYRDFCNIVETFEEVGRKGNLQVKEFFSAQITWFLRAYMWQVPQNWKCYSI